jgi:hypothetical protein
MSQRGAVRVNDLGHHFIEADRRSPPEVILNASGVSDPPNRMPVFDAVDFNMILPLEADVAESHLA